MIRVFSPFDGLQQVTISAVWDGINRTGQGVRLVLKDSGGNTLYDQKVNFTGTGFRDYVFNVGDLDGVSEVDVISQTTTLNTGGSSAINYVSLAGFSATPPAN